MLPPMWFKADLNTLETDIKVGHKEELIMKEKASRYERIIKLPVDEMAAFLSWYFGCDRCPAEKDGCSDNEAMCVDTIRDWLNQSGQI